MVAVTLLYSLPSGHLGDTPVATRSGSTGVTYAFEWAAGYGRPASLDRLQSLQLPLGIAHAHSNEARPYNASGRIVCTFGTAKAEEEEAGR